ncbi:unnamed protein product [Spodoptera littoralis]|uniref:Uncharacterized protein n=1 Tax=Spodoptera littoralis TaxID=7109 RepID=A0A9P0N343_SPOLI|nr:unnamed protein product [Spodoptera littoralis]CAH1639832.1 unnamed protein product [Spodoptera littoralis]
MEDAEDDGSLKDGEETVKIDSQPDFQEIKPDSGSDDPQYNEESVQVDRTALESILNVSSRLQSLVQRNKKSMSLINFGHQSYKDKQAIAKEARSQRVGAIRPPQRFILDNAAIVLNKPLDYVLQYFYMLLDINQETENVVSSIFKIMKRVYIPALQACQGWGCLNPPNPKSQETIKSYISKIMMFVDYLER